MIPIPFGTSKRPLLALYDPPAASLTRNDAVLICHSWGVGYYWDYGTVRNLSRRYAAAGTHAMRFDYFGCGDSGGDAWDASLLGCVEDTVTAIEELQALTEAPTISLVGRAFGALVASLAAAESRQVSQLLLWDPVTEGTAYLERLLRAAERKGQGAPEGWPDNPDAGMVEPFGDPLMPAFARELRGARIDPASWSSVRSAVLVTTSKRVGDYEGMIAEIGETATTAEVAECPWPDEGTNMRGALPVAALDALVGAVA